MLEQPIASRPHRLGCKTLSPIWSIERIGDLRFRPVEWLEDADTSDEFAAVNFFTGPHTVAAQRPSPKRRGHRPPDFGSGRRAARYQVAHHFRVRLHRRIGIGIGGTHERAEALYRNTIQVLDAEGSDNVDGRG